MADARSGLLDLADFAIMNEAISIEQENQWRAYEAGKREG
jgi:hypothetical protein